MNGRGLTWLAGTAGSIAAVATAWVQLDLWQPASAADVKQLHKFSVETRQLFLEDKLWALEAELRQVQREAQRFRSNNETVPRWLEQDELDLLQRIERLRRGLERLENE